MVSVLSCATFTAEDEIPSPSAAMRASDVSEPVRSTVPTMTVIVPSFSRRQAAAAGVHRPRPRPRLQPPHRVPPLGATRGRLLHLLISPQLRAVDPVRV